MSSVFPDFLSSSNINLHYEHYQKQIQEVNAYVNEHPEMQNLTLEDIAARYTVRIGEVASEAINHPFFWKCLSPTGGGYPTGRLYRAIEDHFGSYEEFQKKFTQEALYLFGSGWVWLVYDPTTEFLQIIPREDGYSPVSDGFIPLLALDVWEHSYYIDYGPNRLPYIENFWKYINWNYLEQILAENIFGYRVRGDLPGRSRSTGLNVS
jgi:Fe-Mn family superoxide dismutase